MPPLLYSDWSSAMKDSGGGGGVNDGAPCRIYALIVALSNKGFL